MCYWYSRNKQNILITCCWKNTPFPALRETKQKATHVVVLHEGLVDPLVIGSPIRYRPPVNAVRCVGEREELGAARAKGRGRGGGVSANVTAHHDAVQSCSIGWRADAQLFFKCCIEN